jgi:acid phosphatase family membrane protein YuiD
MLKSPKLTLFLVIVLIAALVVDVTQIKEEFDVLNVLIDKVSKSKSQMKKEMEEKLNEKPVEVAA